MKCSDRSMSSPSNGKPVQTSTLRGDKCIWKREGKGAHQAIAVGGDEWQRMRLLCWRDPEECAALGSAQPLVQVGRVVMGSQGGNIQGTCTHSMRPIHQHCMTQLKFGI